MPEDDVLIEATHGPYAGQRITVSEADAKAAIKEGWAKDPFAAPTPPEEGKEVKEVSEEDRFKIIEAATKAAERLRSGGESPDKAEKKTRAMEAEESAEYQTKSAKAKSDKK